MKELDILRRAGHPDMVVLKEAEDQSLIFTWASAETTRDWRLELLYAIPNAGKRSVREGARFKSQGLKTGFPDMGLPIGNGHHTSLYMELKRKAFCMDVPNPAVWASTSVEQMQWIELLNKAGNHAVYVRGQQHAVDTIKAYLAADLAELARLNQWWVDVPDSVLAKVTKKSKTAIPTLTRRPTNKPRRRSGRL